VDAILLYLVAMVTLQHLKLCAYRGAVAGVCVALGLLAMSPARAGAAQVAFAGLAYSGDFRSIEARFPNSRRFEESLKRTNSSINELLVKSLKESPPKHFDLVFDNLLSLKGSDQVIAVALVITEETVSSEGFGQFRKLFIQFSGQAMFFDFKSMTVLRAYPITFAYIDAIDRESTDSEMNARISAVYFGAKGKPGIVARFTEQLSKASLPTPASRYIQVARVHLSPQTLEALPDKLKSSQGTAATWVADYLSEALSSKTGVPILPYAKGYTIGNILSMRIADGTVFELKLPKPDYELSIDVTDMKKVLYGNTPAGASYIYGVYVSLTLEEPLSGRVYLRSNFKNGEVKVVPASQEHVDDFPAYTDSLRGLFTKLSTIVAGASNAWLKASAAAPDIEKQLSDTREVLRLCK